MVLFWQKRLQAEIESALKVSILNVESLNVAMYRVDHGARPKEGETMYD